MAPSASQLRVGQTFVEMGIDQAFLAAECEKAKAQVAKMAGQLGPAATSAASSGNLHETYITGAIRVGTLTRLVAGGAELLAASIQIGQGDWDALHETMKTMPLGVGEAHKAFLALREVLTGAGAAAEAFGKKMAALDTRMTALGALAKIRDELAGHGIEPRRAAIFAAADKLPEGRAHIAVQRALVELDKKEAQERADAQLDIYKKELAERTALRERSELDLIHIEGEIVERGYKELLDANEAAGKEMAQQLQAAGNLEDLWRNEHKSNAAFQSVTELQRQVMIAGAGTTRDPTIEELKELNAKETAKAERADRWHREIVTALGQIGKPQ
jgi:hypothetical protein